MGGTVSISLFWSSLPAPNVCAASRIAGTTESGFASTSPSAICWATNKVVTRMIEVAVVSGSEAPTNPMAPASCPGAPSVGHCSGVFARRSCTSWHAESHIRSQSSRPTGIVGPPVRAGLSREAPALRRERKRDDRRGLDTSENSLPTSYLNEGTRVNKISFGRPSHNVGSPTVSRPDCRCGRRR